MPVPLNEPDSVASIPRAWRLPRVVALLVASALSAAAWPQAAGWHETFDAGWEQRWQTQRLASRPTDFLASVYDGEPVLRVVANRSAGAIIRRVDGAPGEVSVAWTWLLDAPLPAESPAGVTERERAGDDYAARVFVIFGSELTDAETRAICYVWARHEAPGDVYASPVADRIQTVVVRSGTADTGTWHAEKVDPAADYRRIFGTDPPAVGAIALMSDADDMNSRAAVLFDDIRVLPRQTDQESGGHAEEPAR